MKGHKLVFLEPEMDDLCYLIAQAISRLLEEGSGVHTNDQAHMADPSDEEPSSENSRTEA
jgi:hypothetical protein